MNPPPKLQIFCPVDPAELESTAEGIVCRKCQHKLVNVSCPSERNKLAEGVCGVMRRLAGPVVGTTLALTSCTQDSPVTNDEPRKQAKSEEIPLPGIYFRPGGEIIDPNDYPVAKRTEEQGIVISPYTGSRVDVSRATPGSMVLDPAFKMADKKYFRVPNDE